MHLQGPPSGKSLMLCQSHTATLLAHTGASDSDARVHVCPWRLLLHAAGQQHDRTAPSVGSVSSSVYGNLPELCMC